MYFFKHMFHNPVSYFCRFLSYIREFIIVTDTLFPYAKYLTEKLINFSECVRIKTENDNS